MDFCMTYPMVAVDVVERTIVVGSEKPFLVYWNGERFIVSDDYARYLAYVRLDRTQVPVAVLGDFPESALHVASQGGSELIPPVTTVSLPESPAPLTDDDKMRVLQRRLARKSIGHSVVDALRMVFIGLSSLIQDPSTRERQIHDFLKDNPVVIDPSAVALMSEVRLGAAYRIDLVLQYMLSDKQVRLIELERATHAIFTRSGRLRSDVVHAIQQVEDWLRWWREHPDEVPPPLDATLPPSGLVVVGRNIDMSNDDRRRLQHLNATREVKVITYDDLLDQIRQLITILGRLEEI
jgi:hypothetical protein